MNCLLIVTIAFGCASVSAATLSFTVIQYPGSTYTGTYGIDNNGDIVGSYSDPSNNLHGFLRSATGMLTSFDYPGQDPTGPFGLSTIPRAINDAGRIVGSYNGYPYNAFSRDPSGNLQSVSNATFSGITDNGLITGYTLAGSQDFIIDATGHYTYFTPPDAISASPLSFASGINKSGVVVGSYTRKTPAGSGNASFIRDASGNFTSFSVHGSDLTFATGIDDSGDIVGYYITSDNHLHGFLRAPDGTVQFLDVPGASSTSLAGINNSGQIVGSATINGITEGFVSAPVTVPEPSGWMAMVTAMIVFASISRRAIRS